MKESAAYLSLGLDELRDRAGRAIDGLGDCHACPRDCGVDRLADRWSACKTGRFATVASYFPHHGEEERRHERTSTGVRSTGESPLRGAPKSSAMRCRRIGPARASTSSTEGA